MTFLEKSAQYVFDKAGNTTQLENVCVVLPTRRAVYFFKRALAQCANKPFLAPEVVAIDDLVSSRCGLQIADNVSLLFELYDVFKKVDEKITFDKFLQWASVLLKDFDNIDLYEIKADYVFGYITEAKSLERWRVDWPKNQVSTDSPAVQSQFLLFSNLLKVYTLFQEQLLSQNRAYRGLAYRTLSENVEEILLGISPESRVVSPESRDVLLLPKTQDSRPMTFYYFVGFNALSTAEENIFKKLIKAKRAECLWDTDNYYMSDNQNIEGGELLRKYKAAGWAGDWKWSEDYLMNNPKEIHTYAVPNASMQAKVAGDIYSDWLHSGKGGNDDRPVAIVLADENLLVPMLYALDDDVQDLNVTMGLALKNSLLFTLIDSLFELQFTIAEFKSKEGKEFKIPKFNHRTIQKVLNHPFIRRYEYLALQQEDATRQSIIQKTIRHIQQNNLVYLDSKQMLELGDNHPLFQVLFVRWPNNPQQIISTLYQLIDLLRGVYKDTQNAIETEYLYLFYTLLKQLETTLSTEHVEKLNLKTFKSFLYELIRNTRIPFNGEPLSALQVMGMLETRTLDFDRVIVLSMNEGVLPSSKRQNSLIPWDIAREVGLPIYADQDAVMSYHFYRLLQRAEDIRLIHVTDPNTYNGGEESRFLMQIEHELVLNPKAKISLTKHTVLFKAEVAEKIEPNHSTDWEIPKSEETLQFIKTQLQTRGLYATHWGQYLKCSLQYYFNRVAKISEDEDVEERMNAAEFGSWIHNVLEQIDILYLMDGLAVSKAQIKEILRQEFDKQFRGYEADAGINHLIYETAEQTVLAFLKAQTDRNDGLQVLATEQNLETQIDVSFGGEDISVKIAGKIDRVELIGNLIRVADYKTGKVDVLKFKPENLESLMLESGKPDDEKIRQLWLYQYLVLKKMQQESGLKLREQTYHSDQYDVTAGFYSLRNISKGFITNPLTFGSNLSADDYIIQSEKYIGRFVTEKLLNPNEPFTKTNDINTCKYCDFKDICGR